MAKSKPKIRKRLAKLVLAALLCTGGVQTFFSPSVAEAGSGITFEATPKAFTVDQTMVDEAIGSSSGLVGAPYVYGNYAKYDPSSGWNRVVLGNGPDFIANSGNAESMATKEVSGYEVTVTNVSMQGVVGGISNSGAVTGNTVNISGENTNIYSVAGGGYSVTGTVSKNTVSVSGGQVDGVYGGVSEKGTVSGNTVNISGDAKVKTVYGGGSSKAGNVTGNTVNISGGQTRVVYGGYSTVSVTGNVVNISGGTFGYRSPENEAGISVNEGSLVAGGASVSDASGNTVNIRGGDLEGAAIIGGFVEREESDGDSATSGQLQAKADNNTVNILAPVDAAALLGGLIVDFDGEKPKFGSGSGNTLNVAAKNVSAYYVDGFQNINFYLPKGIANGDTMLTIKTPKTIYEVGVAGEIWLINKYTFPEKSDVAVIDRETGEIIIDANPTDLTGVTFGVAALQGVSLKKGDTVNLIVDKNGLTTDSTLKTADSATLAKAEFLAPHNLATDSQYELSIKKKDENTIIATVDDVEEVTPTPTPTPKPKPDSSDRLKSPVETRIAAVSLVNAGADLLAGQGFRNAADAAADKKAGGGFNSFAAVSGSKLREDSGSHVDVKGINMNLGFARELTNSKGKLLFGPVVEYGRGSYDSYQDSGIHGDGNTHYWGIGVLAKQVNNSGLYYEGSLRAGKTSSDYDADLSPVTHASYDSDATYWAAHLGIGKLQDIGKDNTLDYYGKYFYSHTGGDSVTIHATAGDERMDFSSVNSHRLRVGARITHKLNENNKIYGGLAYQYEFKGNARATYNGGSTPSPTVKGSSGLLELGWQVKPGKGPMSIDLGVTGWVGKQRGVTANVQASWTF